MGSSNTESPGDKACNNSCTAGSTAPTAPPMVRAHSLPTVISLSSSSNSNSSNSGTSSPSPSPSPVVRPASPLRFSGAPRVCDISEDAELDLSPRPAPSPAHHAVQHHLNHHHHQPLSSLPLHSSSASLARPARRRPASPLHHVAVPSFGAPTSSAPLTSPKFNEPFPADRFNSHYPSSLASSSVPSTPTSMRSRSPSISSLETIPDTPDAEAEALEADRIARLKAAADRENGGDQGNRRASLEVPSERRTLGFGKRDSRKRWSVCGAERRGDLDLETIWED